MRVEEQRLKIPIKVENELQDIKSKHSKLLPNAIRCIICGPSGCGKTSALLSLIYHPNGLKFESIYLICKSTGQPKYQRLEEIIRGIPSMNYYVNDISEIADVKSNSVVICDDVTTSDQTLIRDIFSMGRHMNIDCFYLTQTYTAVPKHLIRDNVNCLAIFRQDQLNLRHIFENHIAGDMKFAAFQEMCQEAWKEPFSFLFVAKAFPLEEGRYRKGFHCYFKDINTPA